MNRPIETVSTLSGLVVFDGLRAVAWTVLMKNSVPASGVIFKNIAPGQLYTFIFEQDAEGGHRFEWPQQVRNSMSIDPDPGAVSVQNYVASTGGVLFPNLPGAWGEI